MKLHRLALIAIIVVAGQQVQIPNKYNARRVEALANDCVSKKITQVKSDYAARMLPIVCVNEVTK